MKFKFSFAVVISIIFHVSLFALAFYLPQVQKNNGPIYYVDLMQVPGGGGGGGSGGGSGNGHNGNNGGGGGNERLNDTHGEFIKSGSIKDLVVKKEKQEPISSLRYPDKKNKQKSSKEKKEKPSLISIVKKNKNKNDNKFKTDNSKLIVTQRKGTTGDGLRGDGLRTGISSGLHSGSGTGPGSGPGSGGGIGNGIGTGFGDGTGPGSGPGYFPYTYYIETLKGKISQSWYSSLVSPGLKGKFTTAVYFKILRNGSIADLGLENESGNNSLDLSSLRAIKEAAPFPPLPTDFPGQYLGVHFEFEWER